MSRIYKDRVDENFDKVEVSFDEKWEESSSTEDSKLEISSRDRISWSGNLVVKIKFQLLEQDGWTNIRTEELSTNNNSIYTESDSPIGGSISNEMKRKHNI